MIVSPAEIMTMLGVTTPGATIDPIITIIQPLVEHAIFDFLRLWPFKMQHTEYYPISDVRESTYTGKFYFDVQNGTAAMVPWGYINGDILILKNTPVWNDGTIEVRVDYYGYAGQTAGSFGSGTILTQGKDYWLDISDKNAQLSTSGILRRIGGAWPITPGSVQVKYNGGWSADQFNTNNTDGAINIGAIKLAALQSIVYNYRQFKLLGNQGAAGIVAGPITSESIGNYSYSVSQIVGGDFSVDLPASAKRLLQPHRSYKGYF